MSLFISNLSNSFPPTAQVVLRAVAPIAIDFAVTRIFRTPRAAMIPAFGAWAFATRNVSTIEKVTDLLLYVAYKALSSRFLSDKKNLSREELQRLLHSSTKQSSFKELQQSFKTVILPDMTFSARSPGDEIDLSNIITKWTQLHLIHRKSTNVFRLAIADLDSLYKELKNATQNLAGQPQEQYQEMAALLSDKSKSYYERFCDPSKPTLLFLYRFVRGHVYYTKVEGKYYTHSVSSTFERTVQFFESANIPTRLRETYNEQVKKWSEIIQYLPPEIADWAVPDENMYIAKDTSPERVFKIKHTQILQIPAQEC